jgi:hypothetical protein
MKQLAFAAFVIGNVAFAGSALAQGVDVNLGVGIQLAPGQQGTSPGQAVNTLRLANPDALSPGQQLVQDKAGVSGPANTLAPGHSFENYGRSKKN